MSTPLVEHPLGPGVKNENADLSAGCTGRFVGVRVRRWQPWSLRLRPNGQPAPPRVSRQDQ
jgi:hypothetical protein